jgi:hypothetical protein
MYPSNLPNMNFCQDHALGSESPKQAKYIAGGFYDIAD